MVFFPTGGLLAVVLVTPFIAGFSTGLAGAGAAILLQILWRLSESLLSVHLGDPLTSSRRVLALTTVLAIISYPPIIYKLWKDKEKHYRLDCALFLFPGMNAAVWLGNYAAKELKQDVLALVLGLVLLFVAVWQWYHQSIVNRAIDDSSVRTKAEKQLGLDTSLEAVVVNGGLSTDTTSADASANNSTNTSAKPPLPRAAVTLTRVRGHGYVDLDESSDEDDVTSVGDTKTETRVEAMPGVATVADRSARVRHMSGWARGEDIGDITPAILTTPTTHTYTPYGGSSTGVGTGASTTYSHRASDGSGNAPGRSSTVEAIGGTPRSRNGTVANGAPRVARGSSAAAAAGGAADEWVNVSTHEGKVTVDMTTMDTVDITDDDSTSAATSIGSPRLPHCLAGCLACITATVSRGWRHYRTHQSEAHIGLFAGTVAGFLGGVFGINGPAILIYLTAMGLDGTALRDTCSIVFFMNLPCLVASRFAYSVFVVDEVVMYLLAGPPLLLGVYAGWRLHPHCDTRAILTFLQLIIALSSVPLTDPDTHARLPLLLLYVLLGCVAVGYVVWRVLRDRRIRSEVEERARAGVDGLEMVAAGQGQSKRGTTPGTGASAGSLGTGAVSGGAKDGVTGTDLAELDDVAVDGVYTSTSGKDSRGSRAKGMVLGITNNTSTGTGTRAMRTASIGVWGDDSDAEGAYGYGNAYGHRYGYNNDS